MLNLNIPKMLPDELGTAYLEQVAIGNNLKPDELLSQVRKTKARLYPPSKAQLISEIAGLSIKDFVCLHTCKPFYYAFESAKHWCHPHGTSERRSPQNIILFRNRTGAYFCPKCSSEDVHFWGRSYWRRSHQITGVHWCSKHETPLEVANQDSFRSQPHEVVKASFRCTSSPYPGESTIPGRYQRIVNSILDLRSPVFSPLIISTLKQKLYKENYSCRSKSGGQCFLSDFILNNCSKDWCTELFPNFHKKDAGQLFRDIDTIEFGENGNPIKYTICLATLYHDSNEAASVVSRLVRPQNSRFTELLTYKLEAANITQAI